MTKQSGNFLLQALLVLGLLILFMPFLSKKILSRDADVLMRISVQQLENLAIVTKHYVSENISDIPYNTTVVSGDKITELLIPYGLQHGFMAKTALGQDISIVMIKNEQNDASINLVASGGGLSDIKRANLVRKLGLYAKVSGNDIVINIPIENSMSDIVKRNEVDLDNAVFYTYLDMGDFNVNNAKTLFARSGEFNVAEIAYLNVLGVEAGRKEKNKIDEMFADRVIFQNRLGDSALSLTGGTLYAHDMYTQTISDYGNAGAITSTNASVYDFSMTAGSKSFTGPANWQVHGNLVADNITFNVERLDVGSYINTARGQDVYVYTDDLKYSSQSGVTTDIIRASNITLRDQTSYSLSDGGSGRVIIDIRPAGTSVLPDVFLNDINNDSLQILSEPSKSSDSVESCDKIISEYDVTYNVHSLSQYIICQYIYWQRLENRIDIKQCLLAGNNDCE